MLKIGTKKNGVQYKKRVCAYAIIEREEDKKVAITTDKSGIYFFLGGGLEKNESIEATLEREVIEEAGYSLKHIRLFDKVNSWCYSDKYGYIGIEATIYIAKFDKKIADPIEKNHKVLWVSPQEYKDKLYHEYQRYILNNYLLKMEENNAR